MPIFVVSLLMLGSGALARPTVAGGAEVWSPPVRLSSVGLSSWFPDVAADATGRVHVVWASTHRAADITRQGYDTVAYATAEYPGEWSQPVDIVALPQTGGGGYATRPALLIDPQGMVHVTAVAVNLYYSRTRIESILSQVSWLPPRRINGVQAAYFSRVAVDQRSRLHLVFTENVLNEANPGCQRLGCFHVFYRRSDDGGLSWSAATDLSRAPTGSAKPQILIDGDGVIHVVWESGLGGNMGRVEDPAKATYAASYDGGDTWTSPAEVAPSHRQSRNIALALDGAGTLVLAWLGLPDDVPFYQLSRDHGHSWSAPQPIAGVWGGWAVYTAWLDGFSMATDSAGHVHLILVGRTSAAQKLLSLLHLTWDGAGWSPPDTITTLEGDAPEWPRLAIGSGNQLHAVWFVREQANIWRSAGGKYEIWYAHAASAAPAFVPGSEDGGSLPTLSLILVALLIAAAAAAIRVERRSPALASFRTFDLRL